MAYKLKSNLRWTRIEMLVALYQKTIETLRLVTESDTDSSEQFQYKLKALALISAIESGCDASYGEVPTNVLKLCEFVRNSLLSCDAAELSASINVLQILHDGFAAIQPAAREMERTGVTSKLELVSTLQVDA